MSGICIRTAEAMERPSIFAVVGRAFGQVGEAELVERLAADGDIVLELVAEREDRIVGHILFSRLMVHDDDAFLAAVALAPLAVDPDVQGQGIGRALVEAAHERLRAMGETLSVVVGDPDYYGRFGYSHARSRDFESDYQSEFLQAHAFGAAPTTGTLVYAAAFSLL
jgi:putative acetyltransferase